jgi:hypothetical protein
MRHGTAEQEGREVQVFRFVAEGLHQGLRRTFARVID